MAVLRAAVIICSDAELEGYLDGLTLVGYVDLLQAARDGRPFPQLYDAGVRYVREPPGSEVWQSARATYASREGDCEDLSAGWRACELQLAGETAAYAIVKRISDYLRHILVRRADGTIEDPSLILGMHEGKPEEQEAARRAVRPVIQTPNVPGPFANRRRAA